jgi:hypothetical protein
MESGSSSSEKTNVTDNLRLDIGGRIQFTFLDTFGGEHRSCGYGDCCSFDVLKAAPNPHPRTSSMFRTVGYIQAKLVLAKSNIQSHPHTGGS